MSYDKTPYGTKCPTGKLSYEKNILQEKRPPGQNVLRDETSYGKKRTMGKNVLWENDL